jgi:hypothetical protein
METSIAYEGKRRMQGLTGKGTRRLIDIEGHAEFH